VLDETDEDEFLAVKSKKEVKVETDSEIEIVENSEGQAKEVSVKVRFA
jgi:hypothetical protein